MMAFLGIALLPIGWITCFWIARELAARKKIASDWPLSWALACAAWGLLLTLIVEISSIFHRFNAATVGGAWLVADILLLATTMALARQRSALSLAAAGRWISALRGDRWGSWPADARLFLGFTVFFAAFLFGLAVTLPTTNWDSLTYHLPRALSWIQQQSVDHFSTADTRQIEYGPWSSFVQANFFLLAGHDRLSCLVQWLAMVSCLIVACSIVSRLAGFDRNPASAHSDQENVKRRRLIALTCLLVVTIPIGIVEATNPQTDYTEGLWLLCLLAFTLALLTDAGNRWYALGAGLSCGLGVLTKATMFVYAAPVVGLGGLLVLWRSPSNRARAVLAVLFTMPFLLLNAPHMLRNDEVFVSPLGSPWMFKIERAGRMTAATTASNVIRNLSLHAYGGIPHMARAVNGALSWVHRFTGIDPNDADTTFTSGQFDFRDRPRVYDSCASCFYHVVLILVAFGALVIRPRRNQVLLLYMLPVLASFVLFCAYLKWQLCHSRLHLPYFLALAPVVALVLVKRFPHWLTSAAALSVALFAGFVLVKSESRPFLNPAFVSLPRERQYMFVHQPEMNEPTARVADTIARSGCRKVGLKFPWDESEYPLWVMLRNRGFQGEMRHFYVENESARINNETRTTPFDPCIIVTTRGTPPASVRAQFPFLKDYGELLMLSTADLSPGQGTVPYKHRE